MKKILIAYVPILHQGYINLFKTCGADTIYLVGLDVIKELDFDYIARKDSLRAIDQGLMMRMVSSLSIFQHIHILENSNGLAGYFQVFDCTFVLPNEDLSHAFADEYLQGKKIEYSSVFLRWHRDNVQEKKVVQVDQTIFTGGIEQLMMKFAFVEGEKSADWWRQVGGILIKDDVIVLAAHNTHVPDPQMPYAFGDPRAIFKKGIHIEFSTADHAEAILIAEAARRGISLEGAKLFVTDFPCPPCAKLIARSGIKEVFFQKGYAVLDGEGILKNRGVKLIHIG